MLKENLSFVGICVLVFAALLGLAYLFERTVCRDLQRRSRSRNISYVAMFSALGGVLMLLEIPLFFAPGFYKMDLSELPVLMSAFYLGPVAGVVTELLKVLLKLLLKGTKKPTKSDLVDLTNEYLSNIPRNIDSARKKGKLDLDAILLNDLKRIEEQRKFITLLRDASLQREVFAAAAE